MSLRTRILSAIDAEPIILSHHPMCGKFDGHMFVVNGRQLCIGCFTVYPSAALTLLSLMVMGLTSFSIAFPLALSAFALNMIRFLSKDHRLSVFFNACLGVSLGASLLSAIYAPSGIQPAVVVVGLAVAFSFIYIKGYRVLAVCKRCERYREFPSCHRRETSMVDSASQPELDRT